MTSGTTSKGGGLLGALRSGARHAASFLSESITTPMVDGADRVIQNIDDRLVLIEQRILRRTTSLAVLGFGGAILVIALFFALRDYAGWSSTAASAVIGAITLLAGILLRMGEHR